MGAFLESEKIRLVQFQARSPYLFADARAEGFYRTKYRPYCLPVEYVEQNLFPEIRKTALDHFARHEIKWHDGHNGKPSNHLCDSQVCCVNFLFPFADKPHALAQLLRPIFPQLQEMLPVEDEQFVTFEWIGCENYLGEKISRNGKRTRGSNYTSADAAVKFMRTDGKIHAVLIEWKYTESYGGTDLKFADSGTDRTRIYRHLFEMPDCPIDKTLLPGFDALFYEPFYQFMRQQFLANEMEKAHENGADFASLLHIAPSHNNDFRRITSPALVGIAGTAIEVWKKLVKREVKFTSVSTEQLFGNLPVEDLPEKKAWVEYIQARYPWAFEHD
jgi:hypothetical protein